MSKSIAKRSARVPADRAALRRPRSEAGTTLGAGTSSTEATNPVDRARLIVAVQALLKRARRDESSARTNEPRKSSSLATRRSIPRPACFLRSERSGADIRARMTA